MDMTISQVARGLGIPVSTVERWIRQGRIPAQRQDGVHRFSSRDIEKWARRHSLPFHPIEEAHPRPAPPPPAADLVTAMDLGGVVYDVAGKQVSDVLYQALESTMILTAEQRRRLHRRLVEREALTSTGIGKGIAFPHPRTPLPDGPSDPVIITAFLQSAIDYGAVDDQPVFLLFILLSPSVPSHLHLLSRLAFCVRDDAFVAFLRTIPAKPVLLDRVSEFEKRLEASKTG
jgi:PTS system nitrogen regulatory IIA component